MSNGYYKFYPYALAFNQILDSFDKVHKEIKNSTYPPYDVVRDGDNRIIINFAVAGKTKDDIEINVENNFLKVSGKVKESPDTKFIHKGIASRSFEVSFHLMKTEEVISATMENGILSIVVENKVPEDKTPKKIEIK